MKTLVLALFLLLVLSSCKTDPPPTNNDPIIPATTKVADAQTRDALRAYDLATGQMRFAAGGAVLDNVAVGNVLASQVGPNAPYGYLRKIEGVKRENGEVVLETSQASLDEAISHADIDAAFDLKPEDLVLARALVPGVTAGVAAHHNGGGVAPQEIGIGDGMNFQVGINETLLDIDEQKDGLAIKAKVVLNGGFYFNAGYGIKIQIRGPKLFPPKGPRFEYIEGSVGFEQRASLKLSGDATGKFIKEKKIAEYRFATKCVVIVVVPVCVTPAIFVKIGGSGDMNLAFEYAAQQNANAKVGVRWSPDKGWEKFDGSPQFGTSFQDQFKVKAGLNLEAFAKAEAALLLYNAAGPTLGAKIGVALDAAVPRNPIWILKGQLEGYYGFVVDLPVFGRLAESHDTLFKLEKEFGRSVNTAPMLEVYNGLSTAQLGQEVFVGADCAGGGGFALGYYSVSDLEDGCGGVQVLVSSNLEGALGPKHRFQKAGDHQISVTSRDSQGATANAGFTLRVLNTPPSIKLQYTNTITEGEQQLFAASVADVNEAGVDLCAKVTWSASDPDVSIVGTGCAVKVTFARVGLRTITARVSDNQGVASQDSATLTVQAPPSNPYPRILSSGLYARDFTKTGQLFFCGTLDVALGSVIDLRDNDLKKGCKLFVSQPPQARYVARLEVDNPTNETLGYEWRFEANGTPILGNAYSTSEPAFEPGDGGNESLSTRGCTLRVKVVAPEASRNREAIVWQGTCTYYASQLN